MNHQISYLPINWADGMKMNKSLFIAQDNATTDALKDSTRLHLSPMRYGILESNSKSGFDVKLAIDNQNTLRVTVLACQAITEGGFRINWPSVEVGTQFSTDGVPTASFEIGNISDDIYWAFIIINPFESQPCGTPNPDEDPPRLPYVQPKYSIQFTNQNQYNQLANNPYALAIGRFIIKGNIPQIDENYIPPCFSLSAHPELLRLYADIDKWLGLIEIKCSTIIQKNFKRSQQNELTELITFLCDRVMMYLGQTINYTRWFSLHEAPAKLLIQITSLARVMKNTIDLRIGSGKDQMMMYLGEWCSLNKGQMEDMLTEIANLRYDNNDINHGIEGVTNFVEIALKLFDSLSKLEYIGKRPETIQVITENKYDEKPVNTKGRFRVFG